jgi:hypothetical protein
VWSFSKKSWQNTHPTDRFNQTRLSGRLIPDDCDSVCVRRVRFGGGFLEKSCALTSASRSRSKLQQSVAGRSARQAGGAFSSKPKRRCLAPRVWRPKR